MFVFKGEHFFVYHGGHRQECMILDQAGQAELRKCSRAECAARDSGEKQLGTGADGANTQC